MKKLLRAIKRTLPEIMSVLFLLFLHIVFFTSFGMLLFPRESWTSRNQTDVLSECRESNTESGSICEGAKFFPNLQTSMRSLFVLLTTANNPDVMMPAYMKNRFYAIYFIVYSGIGLYCFLNMLTAVIYNQFRGYLMTSLQSSLFRRRLAVRAAFEVLNRLSESKENVSADSVSSNSLYRVLEKVHVKHRHQQLLREGLDDLPSGHVTVEEFQSWFEAIEKPRRRNRPAMSYVTNPLLRKLQVVAAHHWFDYFGDFISAVNVVFVSIELDLEYDLSLKSSHSALAAANLFFVIYYCAEQSIKLWALGWQRYVSFKGNLYCGGVTVLLVVIEIIHLSLFGSPFNYAAKMPTTTDADYIFSLPNMVRIINMLIIFRLLRVVPNISALSLVAETLLNLVRNLIPFIGIIAAIYYIFAIFGMMLFEGVTNPLKRCAHTNANATSDPCTELDFDKFQYFANNFDDFAAALVNLWDIMIVNNWHVFLKAYEKLVNPWAQLYFLAWYLVSVIMIINLFVALILEAFVSQWEQQQARLHKHTLPGSLQSESQDLRFHQLFRSSLVEPHEAELIAELNSHEYLRFHPSYGTL
ncbi:two pore channel protein 2-like [Nematostella vectensis]|uniref:two pore channel protein 2-like n=1 Tax=Nematostella vectensis TaxID=45351 RepID=UPI0020778424|nr:two pore channel protein 2-like [Nematostella vectensis]